MSKKNNGNRPTASAADRIAVQDALAYLLVCFNPKEKHYYNFLGNNDDGLMHALGCGPMIYSAIMYTANVLGLRKKRSESCDVFYLRTDVHNGWDEMVARHGLADNVQRTTYRNAQLVGLGSINPRAADALRGDLRSFNDMVTVEQQFRLEIPPPRLNLAKRCKAFLKDVGPLISVGFEAMSFEINRQILLEAKAFPGGYEDEDDNGMDER